MSTTATEYAAGLRVLADAIEAGTLRLLNVGQSGYPFAASFFGLGLDEFRTFVAMADAEITVGETGRPEANGKVGGVFVHATLSSKDAESLPQTTTHETVEHTAYDLDVLRPAVTA